MNYYIKTQSQWAISGATIKILLILYNVIFWICGLSLIWFGVWLKIEIQKFLSISDAAYSDRLSFLIFFTGIFIVFIVSLAFTCLIKIQKSMLLIYGGCLLTISFILLFLTIYLHSYKENVIQNLPNSLKNNKQNNKHNQTSHDPVQGDVYVPFVPSTQKLSHSYDHYHNIPNLHTITDDCVKYFNFVPSEDNKMNISKAFKDCLDDLDMLIQEIFKRLILIILCIAIFSLLGSLLSIGLAEIYNRVDYELLF